MVRSKLIIACSNFIFNHIHENYQKYLNPKKKKLMVIFRGINLEYFNKKNVEQIKVDQLMDQWKINKSDFKILLPGRLTRWKGQELFIEALSMLVEVHSKNNFHVIILGSDQGRNVYSKKLLLLDPDLGRGSAGTHLAQAGQCRRRGQPALAARRIARADPRRPDCGATR